MSVEGFNSIEEMFAEMARREATAMANLHPLQRELLPKREFYWMRPYPQMGVIIFGHHDLDASIELERSLTPPEEMAHFPDWVAEFEDRNLVRGYKYGRCYSVIEPEGELGSTHVVSMLPISRQAFEQARELGWDVRGRIEEGTPLHEAMLLLAQLVEEQNRP